MNGSSTIKPAMLFVISASFSVPLYAGDDITTGTGNELIQYCNQKNYTDSNAQWTWCVGYVNGVNDGYAAAMKLLEATKQSTDKVGKPDQKVIADRIYDVLTTIYCTPVNATRQQTALVVAKYLAEDPQELNDTAGELVVSALIKAWPCHK